MKRAVLSDACEVSRVSHCPRENILPGGLGI